MQLATFRLWRGRRHARDAVREARRAESAARQAAIASRLDRLELRVGSLEEAFTKQLAELEPRLLHEFELRSTGIERELASLVQRAEPPRNPEEPPRAISLALLAWFGLVSFGLGMWVAQSCAG